MKKSGNIEDYYFEETEEIPNNRFLPLIIYRSAVVNGNYLVDRLEQIFRTNDWNPAWRHGIYDFPHYHSTAHEVIGVYQGRAEVLFGHTGGIKTGLEQGDVVIIPAGVGHQCLEATPDFHAVGAYPVGQQPDIIGADVIATASVKDRIASLPLPAMDPVHGLNGLLMHFW